MDATCTIQDSIHVFSLVHKYVSRILGTYQILPYFLCCQAYDKKVRWTFFSIIGNRISYYAKKPPAGWHEVSLWLPDVESLIL